MIETGTDSGQSPVVKRRVGPVWLGFSTHHYDEGAVGPTSPIHQYGKGSLGVVISSVPNVKYLVFGKKIS